MALAEAIAEITQHRARRALVDTKPDREILETIAPPSLSAPVSNSAAVSVFVTAIDDDEDDKD